MISVHIEADNPTELADALAELHVRGLVVAVETPNTPTDPPRTRHRRRHLTSVDGTAS